MASEHYGPNGELRQGYYCTRCGKSGVNMVGTGHGEGKCEPNPTLVKILVEQNKRDKHD